jgi:UDP-sugar pyrophosphorylase
MICVLVWDWCVQDASGATARGVQLPLAIMTSDDTHARTEALLKSHNYFGMQPDQVRTFQQRRLRAGTA